MINSKWNNRVNDEILTLEIAEPKRTEDIQYLAALYFLRDKLSQDNNKSDVDEADTIEAEDPPSRIDALIDALRHSFVEYGITKAEHLKTPTVANRAAEVDDLDNILNSLKNIISLIFQSARDEEEIIHLKEFFKPYIDKFKK